MAGQVAKRERSRELQYAIALARAFGAALLFALPLLMTMEMWSLGFSMHPLRLALFTVFVLPLLVGLSRISGFETTLSVWDDALDAIVAYAVGFVASGLVLVLLGVLGSHTTRLETVGIISLQAVPASIGAVLARSLLGPSRGEEDGEDVDARAPGYFAELFVMAVGALFLGFTIAPTEEVLLIAQRMSAGHVVALGMLSILLIDAFVYSLEFRGGHERPGESGFGTVLLRFGVPGYAVALIVSAYVLWTFGRLDGLGAEPLVKVVMVLGFPAAVGAAAARLIL